MDTKVFASRLIQLMDENEDTTYDLAEYLKLDASTISKYRTNKSKPKTVIVKAIAQIYNVNPEWLLGYSDNKYINNYKQDKNIDKLFSNILSIDGLMLDGEVLTDIELAEIKFSINVILEIVRAKKKRKG